MKNMPTTPGPSTQNFSALVKVLHSSCKDILEYNIELGSEGFTDILQATNDHIGALLSLKNGAFITIRDMLSTVASSGATQNNKALHQYLSQSLRLLTSKFVELTVAASILSTAAQSSSPAYVAHPPSPARAILGALTTPARAAASPYTLAVDEILRETYFHQFLVLLDKDQAVAVAEFTQMLNTYEKLAKDKILNASNLAACIDFINNCLADIPPENATFKAQLLQVIEERFGASNPITGLTSGCCISRMISTPGFFFASPASASSAASTITETPRSTLKTLDRVYTQLASLNIDPNDPVIRALNFAVVSGCILEHCTSPGFHVFGELGNTQVIALHAALEYEDIRGFITYINLFIKTFGEFNDEGVYIRNELISSDDYGSEIDEVFSNQIKRPTQETLTKMHYFSAIEYSLSITRNNSLEAFESFINKFRPIILRGLDLHKALEPGPIVDCIAAKFAEHDLILPTSRQPLIL